EMVESSQGVGLPPTELRDQTQNGWCVLGLAVKPAKNEPQVFVQGPSKASTTEKLLGVLVILWCRSRHDLLEGDGKLIRIERAALADFRPRRRYFVPGFHYSTLRALPRKLQRFVWLHEGHGRRSSGG